MIKQAIETLDTPKVDLHGLEELAWWGYSLRCRVLGEALVRFGDRILEQGKVACSSDLTVQNDFEFPVADVNSEAQVKRQAKRQTWQLVECQPVHRLAKPSCRRFWVVSAHQLR